MSKGGTKRQPPLPSSVNPGPAGSEHRGDIPKKGELIFSSKRSRDLQGGSRKFPTNLTVTAVDICDHHLREHHPDGSPGKEWISSLRLVTLVSAPMRLSHL